MYHLVRKTHLFAALILFVFVLLYAVSGYVLEFPKSWPLSPGASTTRSEAFHYDGDKDSPECAAYVKETYDLHGQSRGVQLNRKTGTRDYMFIGAKAFYDAKLPKDADHISIATSPLGFYAMLNRMHHFKGFDGGGIYQVWGVMLDLVAVAMIFFSLSGIYLWYKLTKRRSLGWIMLTISIGYTAATAIYCVYAR